MLKQDWIVGLALTVLLSCAAAACADIVPACTVDTTTQGAWVGKYGADGYILPSFDGDNSDRADLPDYISSYSYGFSSEGGGGGYRWTPSSTSDARALQDPDDTTKRFAACEYVNSGNTLTITLNPKETGSFQLGIYSLNWDYYEISGTRISAISFTGAGLAGTDTISDFQDGKWNVYTVSATKDTPIVISISQTGGTSVNTTISALTFDAVPEPSTTTIMVSGIAGLLAYARRKRR